VEIAWSSACNRVSAAADHVLAETLNRGTKAIEQARKMPIGGATEPSATAVVRNITPDPFRPFGSRRPSGVNGFLHWFGGPKAVAVWLSMAALALAAKLTLRRRFKFAAQERMALTLSKAVRQM
jgi:hypothetical protein